MAETQTYRSQILSHAPALSGERVFWVKPIKTHHIRFGENLANVINKYLENEHAPGDFVALSEKVVSVSQKNVRHISNVRAGLLARLIVKGVKKYPNDIGFSRPEKMQVAVDMAGAPRMLLAMLLGAIGKILGVRGIFWRVAGNRVSEIDGFNPDAMPPYDEYAVLPPKNPEKFVENLEKETGIPVVIIDANNINVEVIAQSRGVPYSKELVRKILLDNPMGQDDEMTPVVLVRG